jgi:hypothetical protein
MMIGDEKQSEPTRLIPLDAVPDAATAIRDQTRAWDCACPTSRSNRCRYPSMQVIITLRFAQSGMNIA